MKEEPTDPEWIYVPAALVADVVVELQTLKRWYALFSIVAAVWLGYNVVGPWLEGVL